MVSFPSNKAHWDFLEATGVLGDDFFDPLPIGPKKDIDHRVWVLESQAAEILGVTKRALERRRQRGTGPAHHNRMGYTSYFLEDLDAWVATKPKGYRPPPDHDK